MDLFDDLKAGISKIGQFNILHPKRVDQATKVVDAAQEYKNLIEG
jgi:hypothetical protein